MKKRGGKRERKEREEEREKKNEREKSRKIHKEDQNNGRKTIIKWNSTKYKPN
ncbi:hypothetical protein L228DRAFT_250307 [Xylona heveae TC161]|uniref:Uncharacterized protein n=1 Tax=Xylona heveae (strain CBS 132557 / TC161) TaxID=1328760 RepID=A0A165A328_XYLHT|nr:hypothetical protein L228DRAFT_250307 [Xylona heveae TC161]KZF19885.1 hypothetical protein L228DRAFT_250307 [Xylona heveae TC161]